MDTSRVFSPSIVTGLVLLFISITLHSLHARSNEGTIRVIAQNPPVVLDRNGVQQTVSDLGTALNEHDIITTGEEGKAFILLSLLSEENEIFVAPSSMIRLSQEIINSDRTIFHIHLIYGKIRPNLQITQSMEIRINTDVVEVVSSRGEFIVEKQNQVTRVGTVEGIVTLTSMTTVQNSLIPSQQMTSVLDSGEILPPIPMPKTFYQGVELSPGEKVDDIITLIKERKKQAEEKKRRYQAFKEKEAEMQRAAKEAELQAAAQEAERQRQEAVEMVPVDEPTAPETSPVEEAPIVSPPPPNFDVSPAEETSFLMQNRWHLVAGSMFLVFSWLALDEAKKYNELESDNSSLQAQYATETSPAVLTGLNVEYEVNKEKMIQHKTNMDRYNLLSLLVVVWEGYLLYGTLTESPDTGLDTTQGALHIFSTPLGFKGRQGGESLGFRASVAWTW